jgi:hypothetical protein
MGRDSAVTATALASTEEIVTRTPRTAPVVTVSNVVCLDSIASSFVPAKARNRVANAGQ